ncbi:MAG: hypothetical protein FWE10_02805 [Rikenellaceae bacterium]|nr:hypothetical protein [Rikenellaceae bacterium]MCL2693092.1 hypothetical protein [Rikenellaceae bacterium]
MKKLLIIAAALIAFGCAEYDKPENTHYVGIGMVCWHGEQAADGYYLLQDNGMELHIVDNLWQHETPENGARARFNYEIVESHHCPQPFPSPCSRDIKLLYIAPVELRIPVRQSFINEDLPHRSDSLGNDSFAEIVGMTFAARRYVDVVYAVWKKTDAPHDINIVWVDDTDDIDGADDGMADPDSFDGIPTLRLRYNARGDAPSGTQTGFKRYQYEVSFDIGAVLPGNRYNIPLYPVKFVWQWHETGKGKTWDDRTETQVISELPIGPGMNSHPI